MGVVTYNNIGGFGRLGNQMFQIASTIGIALDNDIDYCFNHWVCRYTGSDFNHYMEEPLPKGGLTPPIQHKQENNFGYTPIKLDKNTNYMLFGYFQSEKYFKHHRKHILERFSLNEAHLNQLKEKYGDILDNSCSLHIRRGDYINSQNQHTLLDLGYYRRAISELYGDDLDGVNVLIFSDDIKWCKQNLDIPKANVHYISNNVDILDMFLMSLCTNNIIANSSFSWWGAWLNQNENKKVVAPKNWFGPHNSHLPTKDLLCEDWIII
jgi:hypothetical protein